MSKQAIISGPIVNAIESHCASIIGAIEGIDGRIRGIDEIDVEIVNDIEGRISSIRHEIDGIRIAIAPPIEDISAIGKGKGIGNTARNVLLVVGAAFGGLVLGSDTVDAQPVSTGVTAMDSGYAPVVDESVLVVASGSQDGTVDVVQVATVCTFPPDPATHEGVERVAVSGDPAPVPAVLASRFGVGPNETVAVVPVPRAPLAASLAVPDDDRRAVPSVVVADVPNPGVDAGVVSPVLPPRGPCVSVVERDVPVQDGVVRGASPSSRRVPVDFVEACSLSQDRPMATR